MARLRFFITLYFFLSICLSGNTQTPDVVSTFLRQNSMKGCTFACSVREISTGKDFCAFQEDVQVTPASVMKIVTTATALEILGGDFRYATSLAYDGNIIDGTLHGNIYIVGSGDPTLGSSHFAPESKTFVNTWVKAVRDLGIREIDGAVISDESIFDTEGVSPKWLFEDLGNYYGAGSYGISVFDNQYKLLLRTVSRGKPQIIGTQPSGVVEKFHNYLVSASVRTDSCYISGAPFSGERFLYGVVPAGKNNHAIKGDIPDPPLFLARYLSDELEKNGITVKQPATCYRLLQESGKWQINDRKEFVTTYSPPLSRIIEVTNHASHNLFADALLKTIGLRYRPREGEFLSSFSKGIRVVADFWKSKGLDVSGLYLYDGSGLSPADKMSAGFLTKLLCYMANQSSESETFLNSLPLAGEEGSVRNFLKGSVLQGSAKLKSGSMSCVRAYAGYVDRGGKRYAVAFFLNQYNGSSWQAMKAMEKLIEEIFR